MAAPDIAVSPSGKWLLRLLFAVFVAFLYIPLFLLVVFSFNDNELPVFPLRGFTTRAYEQFLSNPELKASIVTSVKVSAAASVVAVALGLLASIALVRKAFAGKSAVAALLISPLIIPYIVFAIALLILFVQIDKLPVVRLPLSMWTLVIGHVVILLPAVILILVPRLEKIDIRIEEAAQDLGAGSLRTFRSITLPLIWPALLSAFLVSFVFSFDEIILASFVAGDATTFPLYLFSQLRFPSLLPQVIAVSVIVFAVSMVVILCTEVGRRVLERKLDIDLAPPPPEDAAA
jgi:spermidine/putrescine transport system permease protein